MPGRVASAGLDDVAACWFTADDEVLERRIYTSSGFDRAEPYQKALIQKFVLHNQCYNALLVNAVTKFGLNSIDTGNIPDVDALIRRCVAMLEG